MNLPPKATQPTMYFIGVTTTKSSIMKLFPLWAKAAGLEDAVLKGIDLEIHADPKVYREVAQFIKDDELSLGALVTTHKIDWKDHGGEVFLMGAGGSAIAISSYLLNKNRGEDIPSKLIGLSQIKTFTALWEAFINSKSAILAEIARGLLLAAMLRLIILLSVLAGSWVIRVLIKQSFTKTWLTTLGLR